MKKEYISIFLPTRKGSQRVKDKNTRPFVNNKGGLLELKLSQLIKISTIYEILVSTNDAISISIAHRFRKLDKRIKIIERPERLSLDTTDLIDLVKYIPSITNSEHILWTHVTSPFLETKDYENAIKCYFDGLKNNFDSLMSVRKFSNYLWSNELNDIINRVNDKKWPQTQDLKELFEIDSALFIASRNIYIEKEDRIGMRPKLFINDGIKSFDIDWEEDFMLAEYIYKKINDL